MKKRTLRQGMAVSQSAMEYLMTYGWSILIVAVVLGALAYLGVFNPLYFAPKANPGSCQVYRPNGPGTAYDINLLGTCSGEIPEFVAAFNGNVYSYITANSLYLPTGSGARTITAWIYANESDYNPSFGNDGVNIGIVGWGQANGEDGVSDLTINIPNELFFLGCNWHDIGSGIAVSSKKWTFIAASYAAGADSITLYVNEKSQSNGFISGAYPLNTAPGSKLYIGTTDGGCVNENLFAGEISNVQIYNASLDSASINSLYMEGIGGAPIDMNNLVAWYPLNGDAKDYSGNGQNGVASKMNFTSSWIGSYTQP